MSLESKVALQRATEKYADYEGDRFLALDRRIATLEGQVELLIAALTTATEHGTYNA